MAAPDHFKAVCAGEADFTAWPLAEWCNDSCKGHPLCGPCAALSIQRKELNKLIYQGADDTTPAAWEPEL